LSGKIDPRALVCFGILWLGGTTFLRTHWTSGADFWSLAFPQMVQGLGMPFFIVPLTTIALGAVEPHETASAAGVMSFLRTMAGAIGTSVATTMFADGQVVSRSEIVASLRSDGPSAVLQSSGLSLDQARGVISRTVDQESAVLAINHMFLLSAIIFVAAAMVIWLAPRPKRAVGPGAAH
jgi:DHA2 family multidrug resistance protein